MKDAPRRSGPNPPYDPAESYAKLVTELGRGYVDLLFRAMRYWDSARGESAQRQPDARRAPTQERVTQNRYPVTIDTPVIADAYIDSIELDERKVTLSGGEQVVLPFRFWRTQALLLTGRAQHDKIRSVLAPHGLSPILDGTGAPIVHIYAPNYAGSSVGPVAAVFASILVHDDHFCGSRFRDDGGCLDGEFFWQYRTSDEVNHRFKREVWGIQSQLAAVAFDYLGNAKGVALLEDNALALRMVWSNKSRIVEVVELPGEQRFTSVTPLPMQTYRLTRFRGAQLSPRRHSYFARGEGIAFDAACDELNLNADTPFGRALLDVGFEPLHWNFYTDYGGVVEIPHPDRGE